MQLQFEVDAAGDHSVGLPSYHEAITLSVESGDPGGEPGEFAEAMREALADWFDGARVTLSVPAPLVTPPVLAPGPDAGGLRRLLEVGHGARATHYADLFALGCWLHRQGQPRVGRKLVEEVVTSVMTPGERTYLTQLLDQLAGHEARLAREIHAHPEVNALVLGD